MTSRPCDQLDDYLCGWLSPDEAGVFEAHLADCAACREARALQRQIDHLLAERTGATAAVPIALRSQVHSRIQAARRRLILRRAGVAAACVVVLSLVFFATKGITFAPREARQSAQHSPVENDVTATTSTASAGPPIQVARVTLIDPSSAIVVPLDSNHPNVTLVRVFKAISVTPQDDVPSALGTNDTEELDVQ
jgi:anti-sigma factor RsiW